MSVRLWSRCAWGSLIAWAVFVVLEQRARKRDRADAIDLDALARRNGRGDEADRKPESEPAERNRA